MHSRILSAVHYAFFVIVMWKEMERDSDRLKPPDRQLMLREGGEIARKSIKRGGGGEMWRKRGRESRESVCKT